MLRVVQMGLGPVGRSVARLAAERRGISLVGAADPDPSLAGRDLGEVIGLRPMGILVSPEADSALEQTRPELVLDATASFLRETAPHLRIALARGVSVISTCEELVYPFYRHPELTRELDGLARSHGAVLLGTGVNPGFVMDKLVATLLGACRAVESVRVKRVVDASRRRESLQRKVGAGLAPDEFEKRKATGRFGHVGLGESAHMLADVIGVSRDRELIERFGPKIARRAVKTEFLEIAPGQVAGIEQLAVVEEAGKERVRLELEMFAGAENPSDRVQVDGSPPLDMTFAGGVHGDEATAAIVVNCACQIRRLGPGLRTMLDVPLRFAPVFEGQ